MRKLAAVNRNVCVACGACARVCCKEAITIHRGCYAQVDAARCVGCGLCAGTCPASCISMTERDERHEEALVR